jgi:Raf kinase inhibitor-like YbhB/YbcL family protein
MRTIVAAVEKEGGRLQISSQSIENGAPIADMFALAIPADEGHVSLAENVSPHLAWTDVPQGTRSFVITCIDADCPSSPVDVNQEDREVPTDLRRVDFTHWLLVDIPPETRELGEGSHASGVVPRGKAATDSPVGVHGQNDYTAWFDGDPDMGGSWNGYDGPAPPWNDSIPHRYTFTVAAIDTETLALPPGFDRVQLETAIAGRVLDSDSLTVTYSLNPSYR